MVHVRFCDPFAHAVNVDVQPWQVLVQHHHNVLCPTVCECRNENGSSPLDHCFNRRNESINFFLFWRMISSAVRTFNEQNVSFHGLSSVDQRRVSRVKVPCQKTVVSGVVMWSMAAPGM